MALTIWGNQGKSEGNARAVIMDENNVRIKDVTAKEVQKIPIQ